MLGIEPTILRVPRRVADVLRASASVLPSTVTVLFPYTHYFVTVDVSRSRICSEHCRMPSQGGALASCLHTHMDHGDPFVRGLVQRTMVRACESLFFMVKHWVFEGELVDHHK